MTSFPSLWQGVRGFESGDLTFRSLKWLIIEKKDVKLESSVGGEGWGGWWSFERFFSTAD